MPWHADAASPTGWSVEADPCASLPLDDWDVWAWYVDWANGWYYETGPDLTDEQVASLVVGGDLGAELLDAGAQDVLVDQNLADVRVDGRHSCPRSALTAPSQPGASSRPTTATTAPSAVATSGQASRSSLGTLASTSTS